MVFGNSNSNSIGRRGREHSDMHSVHSFTVKQIHLQILGKPWHVHTAKGLKSSGWQEE